MRRLGVILVAVILLGVSFAPSAHGAFGFSELSVSFTEKDGSPSRQAGSHPYAMRTFFRVNSVFNPEKGANVVDGALRDLEVTLPAGLVGNPTAVPRCETIDFLTPGVERHPGCPDGTAVGTLNVALGGGTGIEGEETVAVYNLQPSPGQAAKFGFIVAEAAIVVEAGIAEEHPYQVVATLSDTSQIAEVLRSDFVLWGNPASKDHDEDRGNCAYDNFAGSCPANLPEKPFLTLPRSCQGELTTTFEALSWWSGNPTSPGPPETFQAAVQSPGLIGCSKLAFGPTQSALPTTNQAESPSGLDFDLAVEDEGIVNPAGVAASDIKDATVTFPQGITANPSLAEGLFACSVAQLAAETVDSPPSQGCPPASKIGTIEVTTPVLEGKTLHGALYIATPDDPASPGKENPFDALLAQYVVIRDKGLGLLVKQAGKLTPDPRTGQLVASFADLPPFPLQSVHLRLREGGRSPLITPPACGTYETVADFVPSAAPGESLEATSTFAITRGVGGGGCPSGRLPFEPSFEAGSANNSAAAFTSFHIAIERRDGDQDLTRFDATLPPGVLAKLAGVGRCPDAAIAQAQAKAGRAELAQPSCPAVSRIGGVWGGAGVGSQLTYVPGDLYLAGPVRGAPLSMVGVVPAVAGPFDVGTVVVRQALRVNPVTGEAVVDGAASDPIPHILAGIPLRVRDIRVDVDRPDFTLNPTDCDPFATTASIWGGGLDPFSAADDSPVGRSDRFQAANCAALGFAPRLKVSLRGGTKRGGHPALRSVYQPRPGDANLSSLVLRLPRSAFLDQAHIRTICTRVQFAANACPPGAVYGQVTATTPLLEEPLSGPAYLRSSDNELPDLVFDLHGLVDIEVSARIDSIKGGIRATFPDVPDAPITKVVVAMRGGNKGLIVNSRDLCEGKARANAQLTAQSGKLRAMRPVVRASGCGGKKRRG